MTTRKTTPSDNQLLTRTKAYWPACRQFLQDALLLLLSFFTALTFAPLALLRYKNPYDISNQYNASSFNPDNNFLLLVVIGVLTIGLFYLFRFLVGKGYIWSFKLIVIFVLLSNYFIVHLLFAPHGYSIPGTGFDNFHGGEQLSPMNAFNHGTNLYSQIFLLRGAGLDVLFPLLGLKVLGQSIGAFSILQDLFILAAQFSFYLLAAFIVRNPFKFLLFCLFFTLSTALSITEFRDLTVWLVIGLTLLAFRRGLSNKARNITLFSIGVLSSIMLYITIDRGLILFGSTILLALLLTAFGLKKDQYVWQPAEWTRNLRLASFVWGGLAVGFFLPAPLLGPTDFSAFIKMTFQEVPNYAGLLVSQPFPPLFSHAYPIWGPLLLAIATGLLLLRLHTAKGPRDYNVLLPYTIVFVFAALSIKMGTNRIDITKMASVTGPLFFIVLLIAVYAARNFITRPRLRSHVVLPLSLVVILLIMFANLDWTRLLHQPVYKRSDFIKYAQLRHTPDTFWLDPQSIAVSDYIKKHTRPSDYIFAFTSDPAYYYLTDRPNPSRFYVTWYADPQPNTDRLLHDLKLHPPKYIIYSESTWMDIPDNIPIAERIPEVNKWILDSYPTQTRIRHAVIRSR